MRQGVMDMSNEQTLRVLQICIPLLATETIHDTVSGHTSIISFTTSESLTIGSIVAINEERYEIDTAKRKYSGQTMGYVYEYGVTKAGGKVYLASDKLSLVGESGPEVIEKRGKS